jgi:hypothetical protein
MFVALTCTADTSTVANKRQNIPIQYLDKFSSAEPVVYYLLSALEVKVDVHRKSGS